MKRREAIVGTHDISIQDAAAGEEEKRSVKRSRQQRYQRVALVTAAPREKCLDGAAYARKNASYARREGALRGEKRERWSRAAPILVVFSALDTRVDEGSCKIWTDPGSGKSPP